VPERLRVALPTLGRLAGKTCANAKFTSRVVRRNGAARIAANRNKNRVATPSLRCRLFTSLSVTIPLSYGESNYASRAYHRCPSSLQPMIANRPADERVFGYVLRQEMTARRQLLRSSTFIEKDGSLLFTPGPD
jgi:hypothetical protein